MKRIFLVTLISILLVGCATNKTESTVSALPTVDKKFVENKAEIGLSKEEVKAIFGKEYISGYVDSSDLWLYDRVKENYEYDASLEAVSHEEIKNDSVEYQLYINFVDDKAFMYSYFYKSDDGRVWTFTLYPDETTSEVAVSR